MSKVGLVLGGGGITGASYHFGALFALELATGWDPDDAEVIVGTSCGAFVAAMVRGKALHLETLVGDAPTMTAANQRLHGRIYRRGRPHGLLRWLRRGVVPGLVSPSPAAVLGSPGLYCTDGIEEWVTESIGRAADGWPHKATVITAYELESRRRVAFGTEGAPDVPLKAAVAASSAVPFLYQPVHLDGKWYVDGGVASGTSADLVLAADEPLDLVIVVAPVAAAAPRRGGRFYEEVFDRAGRTALAAETERIRSAWPATDVVVLRPDEAVMARARPNPMAIAAAIPAFLATMRSMRRQLARSSTWDLLDRHLSGGDDVAA